MTSFTERRASDLVLPRPALRPRNPSFSSGPCPKRPGWHTGLLTDALVGRSHRSAAGRQQLRDVIARTREILEIPADYRIAIVPGSDTGAIELSLWTFLGARGIDVLAWETFGLDWVRDVAEELRLPTVRTLIAPYGELPDLSCVDFDRDVVFTWNGTTSGVRVPSGAFIPASRRGLTICDATSAVFAQQIDWSKLDVTTFSWQKAIGGEAAHGMLVLGPRAVERLAEHAPNRPIPKLFRIMTEGQLTDALFDGWPINTPSMLCVADYLDALGWAQRIGGLPALRARADANAAILSDWVETTAWIDFLARDPATRSNTSMCLRLVEPAATRDDGGKACAAAMVELLDHEGVAYDIGAHREAPPGLRIWCGCTIEAEDVAALTHWLNWAYRTVTAVPHAT